MLIYAYTHQVNPLCLSREAVQDRPSFGEAARPPVDRRA